MTLGAFLLIAQATVAPVATASVPADVELRAHVEAKSVTIEQAGPIKLELHAEPGGTDVKVDRSQPAGAKSYRNLTIDARVAAYLKPDTGGSITPQIENSTGEPPQ